MNAEAAKVNTGNTLEAFPCDAGAVRSVPLKFPDTEREAARKLVRVNTPEQFRAFVRAAHGRVRHSVKWRTSKNSRRFLKASAIWGLVCETSKLDEDWAFIGYNHPNHKKSNRQYSNKLSKAVLEEKLEDICPNDDLCETMKEWWNDFYPWSFNDDDDIQEFYHFNLDQNCYAAWQPNETPEYFTIWRRGGSGDLIRYALLTGNRKALIALVRAKKREMRSASISQMRSVLKLITEGFRAHVRKRVKRTPRRDRLPRPVHTVPRPPTSPQAPPA